MGKNSLVSGTETETLVAGKHIVHECRAAAPMAENKDRIFHSAFFGERGIALLVNGKERVEQPAHTLCNNKFPTA